MQASEDILQHSHKHGGMGSRAGSCMAEDGVVKRTKISCRSRPQQDDCETRGCEHALMKCRDLATSRDWAAERDRLVAAADHASRSAPSPRPEDTAELRTARRAVAEAHEEVGVHAWPALRHCRPSASAAVASSKPMLVSCQPVGNQ